MAVITKADMFAVTIEKERANDTPTLAQMAVAGKTDYEHFFRIKNIPD